METLSCRAMRLALNNTVVFGRQARVTDGWRLFGVALAALLLTSGCRKAKKAAPSAARAPATAELASVRPPPPPAETLPAPAAVPAPPRRGGTMRVHLDGEPPNLMPLGDVEASALQVTAGLVYETLLDCSDGSYKPGLAESWDVSDDRMRLAVRVRGGVRWHDHRAFGVLDVQATIEPLLRKGNDAAALRAALADVVSLELVTERTVRFVLKRPSDLVLRALCDVPILPDHIIRNVRVESAPIARAPIGTGPYKFVAWERGKRIRLERSPDYWGAAPGVDELVFDVDNDAVRALNRTRRGEIDVLARVLDVHYPDQVEPTTLHGAATLVRLESRRY
jgi:peptide/nickel transport system substrate-binding protein